MSYYAQFHQESGSTFRLDTRIYLDEHSHSRTDGTCVAAVVGKNPGSAEPLAKGGWGKLNLNGDKTLPSIRNRFLAAYRLRNEEPPKDAFVQVWNLFYLCNKDFDEARHAIQNFDQPCVCGSEPQVTKAEIKVPKIVWFIWGGHDKHDHINNLKNRFSKLEFKKPFFYDNLEKKISEYIPTLLSFARHTRGLLAQPIIQHLKNIL